VTEESAENPVSAPAVVVAEVEARAARTRGVPWPGGRRGAAWLLAYIPLAIFATQAGWRVPGWPINHEFFVMFERVEAFRRAYLAGDWFPLWTPFSNNGHGSPIPFFYHRLFNTGASLLAVVAGSTYAGVKVACCWCARRTRSSTG
jgi:hypothetical protein